MLKNCPCQLQLYTVLDLVAFFGVYLSKLFHSKLFPVFLTWSTFTPGLFKLINLKQRPKSLFIHDE